MRAFQRSLHESRSSPAGVARGAGVGALLALCGAAMQLGCTSMDGPTNPSNPGGQTILIESFHDTSFDFTSLRTFAMPDTVVHRGAARDVASDVTRSYDRGIIDHARADLVALGFTEVQQPSRVRPDFVVLIETPSDSGYPAWSNHPWYDVWGFYSGWGWYTPTFNVEWSLIYPWYPSLEVPGYARGSLLFTLVATAPLDSTSKQLRSSWAGAAGSLLSSGLSGSDIEQAIDIMFILSPYLHASTMAVAPDRRPAARTAWRASRRWTR